MEKPYTGGCACGAIRYSIEGEPLFSNHCQCRDCQRESGSGHGSYATFARAGVTLTGDARHWDMVADSGKVKTRGFCTQCGVAVYMTFAAQPDVFTIRAASLDEPARYKPQAVTFAARGHEWDPLDAGLMKFEGMPPG
ncbi:MULTISPECIES: GFA family protein [Bradyrhizobium]|uniref:GFA family protein n=1 Tax=Bradyrhizobium TaxID=374 RepID=UPI00155EEC71|nr:MULTISPECIES: GFA family protein [Bradyrhizobium]MDD1521460.1 aldehyde-activating protein [Bradyrhizobium sp. WBAH30]MDD1545513.1 aldehyde-activating protein [Bradyrhizobium sp. WBAH41]MDD1554158.1 aldehyde-activating protein [Bradyrhizobium sp. WBAH23]MDD1562109.1 aldehyde-activating protein [Bradyrhizobium sp. WBAH33]MDD1591644.1 aldehyde-activating protein [Bradyrhizobium sp. WBAH42]